MVCDRSLSVALWNPVGVRFSDADVQKKTRKNRRSRRSSEEEEYATPPFEEGAADDLWFSSSDDEYSNVSDSSETEGQLEEYSASEGTYSLRPSSLRRKPRNAEWGSNESIRSYIWICCGD